MNFELTRFIYPLKEKISYSKHLNLYLDNPRTPDEIEFFSNLLIKSYENENNSIRLDISVMLTPRFGDIDPPCSKWFKEQIV
jgi:hypothetical protein